MDNKNKVILDLCGGTGAWSKPYKDNGYEVFNITKPDYDVRYWRRYIDMYSFYNPYGILAAPPCTHFSGSGARWWQEKDNNGKTLEDLQIITAILMAIASLNPKFWCIENPVGRLNNYLGHPRMYFDPCDYGDPYTKKTCLWGNFNIPEKKPVKPKGKNPIHHMPPSKDRGKIRSITPQGFAKAFYEANK